MKRTILIPTDFSIESLNLFKAAVQSGNTKSTHIVFFHAIYSSNSFMELLFTSQQKIHQSLITENFRNGRNIIRNKFKSSIASDRIEFFSGATQTAFQNFLDGNGITEIFFSKNHKFKQASTLSFDPLPMMTRSNLPKHDVSWNQAESAPEKNMLAELFSDPVISIL